MGQEFYIGWKDEAPENNKRSIRKLLIWVISSISLVAVVLVLFSKSFNNHIFEFGEVKTFTGNLYLHPFPILQLDEGQSPYKNTNYALLVGYGKSGAATYLDALDIPEGDLSGKRVTMTGTLIYGSGKVLIELTEKGNSLLEVGDAVPAATYSEQKKLNYRGEIIDPKCWFGVMKPAEGKVHKSCAIRCISGGIPPVYRIGEYDSGYNYTLILDENGNTINEKILPYVGEPVFARGDLREINGWDVLQLNLDDLNYLK